MALVYARPGDPSSGLVALKCSGCRQHKMLNAFPPSCAKWGRGWCALCSRARWLARKASIDPILKKWDSARVRYGGANGVTRADIVRLYEAEGYDVENDPIALLRAIDTTVVIRADERLPFSASNLALKLKTGTCERAIFLTPHAYQTCTRRLQRPYTPPTRISAAKSRRTPTGSETRRTKKWDGRTDDEAVALGTSAAALARD